MKWYKSVRPETIYVVKNPKRFDDVSFAIRTIAELAESSNPGRVRFSAPIDPEILDSSKFLDELTGTSMCFEIITDLIVFDDMEKFREVLAVADNFEICARTDGKFSIGIVFEDVFRLADPYEK